VNGGGTSALSGEASATPEPAAPAAPTGLTAAASNGSVTLSWSASLGASSYNIYRGTAPGGEGNAPIAAGVTATSYIDTGLTNGTKYYYRVAAVNSGGTSAESMEVSATPLAGTPAPPAFLTATAGNGAVELRWMRSLGATSYNIYRGTGAGGEGTTPVASGVTGTSYSDKGLTNGTTYYYKVAAVNAAGAGTMSREVEATPEPGRRLRGTERF